MASGRKTESLLCDTHVILWYAHGSVELGSAARATIQQSLLRKCLIVSAVSAWEIALLVRKGRLRLRVAPAIWWDEAREHLRFREVPLRSDIAFLSQSLPGDLHGDPADRFLLATAIAEGLPLITADRAVLGWGMSQQHCRIVDARM